MATVAAHAKVSQMTVSRALREDPSIPEATRIRIKRIAARLGYRPDPAVSQLMARMRRSRLSGREPVAWITTHPTASGWQVNPAAMAFHRGARARAEELGYQLEEFWLNAPGMSGHRLSEILQTRGIRGVLISPLYEPRHDIGLHWDRFAAATCGAYSLKNPGLHRACSHYFMAIKTAWDALQTRGYRRIGLALSADLDTRVSGLWLACLLLEQRACRAKDRIPPLVSDDWTATVFMRWFEKHRPDVVISFKTVYEWLTDAGIRIPQDCGFALLNIERANTAGIDEQQYDVGAAALDLIAEQLVTNQLGVPAKPKTVLVDCCWRDGASVRTMA